MSANIHYLTPPKIAAELSVRVGKVLAWIRRGELTAVNVAQAVGGRPRWRIRRADLEDFLLRRQCQPKVKPVRKRNLRRTEGAEVVHYFS